MKTGYVRLIKASFHTIMKNILKYLEFTIWINITFP